MSLVPGTRLGPYEVTGLLGAGGMGEFYRATDTRLKRQVAIKALPPALAADADRLARFQREAEVLASLNHPHIAAIYGLEEADGVKALVMELVEGPTLADRIAQGPIPIDEGLPLATQIAEALEAAHEQGIVHRDLKPANIKVRADGTVKVLDFGLAKALEPAAGIGQPASGAENSPTITSPALTLGGVILGTAAYMSPEQARGKPLDRRTDIWAFGCVLYEMLTGRRAFAGDDVSDVLASVLAREADFGRLPGSVPTSIRRLLRRCLQKDRAERLRDIGDARIEIRDAMNRVEPEAATVPIRRSRERVLWIGAVAALALALIASWVFARRTEPASQEMRLEITTPPTTVPNSVAISPDGRRLAFVAASEGELRLWLRSMETGVARAIAGTEGAAAPFWSPNSRSVAFFAAGRLKRIDVDGGSVATLANARAVSGEGGSWNRADVILFASLGIPIQRVSATGGEAVTVTGLALQGSDFSPTFLPDGRRFLYYLRGTPEVRGVYVGDLDEKLEPRRLLDSDGGAVFAPSGHLFFARQGALLAQSFDPARLEVTGSPVQIAERVAGGLLSGVSVSNTGTIVYRTSSPSVRRQFAWFDRSGHELGKVGEPVTTTMASPSLSPDGQRVAFYRGVGANPDIWMVETGRGVFSRFTSDVGDDVGPVWSPQSDRIVFASNRQGTLDLYVKSVTTGAGEELLLSSPQAKFASDWTRDGRFILFNSQDPKAGSDIWAVATDGKAKPFPVAQTAFQEWHGQFSPDGNWVAYQSDDSGWPEIFLQSFPSPGTKWPVSSAGGTQVRWRRDGRELFYVALDGKLMAVPIRLGSNSQSPDIGTSAPLFTPPLGGGVLQGDYRIQYMVAADGARFLVATVTEEVVSPIAIILNWKPRP